MQFWLASIRRCFVTALLVLGSSSSFAAEESRSTSVVKAHVTFLADDLLEGRGTGTRGYDLAAAYVAAQFERLGIQPGADGKNLQPVALRESRLDAEAGRMVLHTAGGDTAFEVKNDFLAMPASGSAAGDVSAEAVFVGYGVDAPQFGYNDFNNVDLKGKIAVVLPGAPSKFPSEVRAHFSSTIEKSATLVRHGAVGAVFLNTPEEESRYPWAIVLNAMRFPSMRLISESGAVRDGFPELQVRVFLRRDSVAKFLASSGRKFEDLIAAAGRGEPQSFALGFSLTLSARAEIRPIASSNVIGWLPGSDPALAAEPVVITAHLDHLGIGGAVNGDTIYNGAMDNAIGTALMLATAETLAHGPQLRRPVLFAAVTGEEKGLLGAYHLAAHPPKSVRRFAANVNLDMALFPAPVRDVIAWGAEHSSLGAIVNDAAQAGGFTVSPDPWPSETIFVRSDQYAFVRIGVPAIFLSSGTRTADGGNELAEMTAKFRRERYHKPSDDLSQSVHWPSAGAFADYATDVVRRIGNESAAPKWNAGNFFGKLFGPDRVAN